MFWTIKRVFFSVAFFSLFYSSVFSQKQITVLDKKTKEPIAYAHILFETIDGRSEHEVTDMSGRAINRAHTKNDNIIVSFIGYEKYESTIGTGEFRTIYLVPQIFNVGEVVVTGQYEPQRVDKSIYKISVIGSKQVAEKGANNLGELLTGESNIQIQQDGVLGSSLKMQGLTGENVKILIDGVPLIGRMAGNIDLGQIDLSNVDHIEIIEGPMSVVYGTNALAGTINIITKENIRNSVSSQIKSYFETVGVYNFDVSGTVHKNLNTISLSGGRNFFGGYKTNPEKRKFTYKPKEQYKAMGSYVFKHNELKIKLSSRLFKETVQDLGEILLIPEVAIFANDQYFYTTRMSNNLQLNSTINDKNSIEFLGGYSTYIRAKNTFRKDMQTLEQNLSTDATRHDTTTFNSILARGFLSHSYNESKFDYQAGFDINIDDGKGKRIADTLNSKMGDYAAFVSTKYKLNSNVSLQPGLRFIYNTKYKAPVIPSINIKSTLFNNFNIRASYAKGFRSPSLKELYLDFVDANHNIHGNPNLKAETSDSYNMSVSYEFDTLKHTIGIDGSAYYNDGKNVIALIVIDPAALYYKNENIDIRKTKGGTFNIKYNFYPRLTINTGLSITGVSETLTVTAKDSVFNTENSEWEHLDSTFLADYQFTKDFSLNLKYKIIKYDILLSAFYKYNGRTSVLFTDYNDEGNEFINRFQIAPFHTLDVTMTKKFFKNKISVVLGAKNLFNNINALISSGGGHGTSTSGSPVGWGRTYFLKMSYNFNKN